MLRRAPRTVKVALRARPPGHRPPLHAVATASVVVPEPDEDLVEDDVVDHRHAADHEAGAMHRPQPASATLMAVNAEEAAHATLRPCCRLLRRPGRTGSP